MQKKDDIFSKIVASKAIIIGAFVAFFIIYAVIGIIMALSTSDFSSVGKIMAPLSTIGFGLIIAVDSIHKMTSDKTIVKTFGLITLLLGAVDLIVFTLMVWEIIPMYEKATSPFGYSYTTGLSFAFKLVLSMTSIVSVEKKPDGSFGKICIEVGNKAYLATFEKNYSSPLTMNQGMGFVPGSEYTDYIPKDLNFEHFICACAVNKKPMHAYIHPDRFPVWFDIYSLPLNIDDPHKYYCTYTQEISRKLVSNFVALRIFLRRWMMSLPMSALSVVRTIAAFCSRISMNGLVPC